MDASGLVVGNSYVYRERRIAQSPTTRVTLLAKLSRPGKVRIRFEDGPYSGLEDYANTRQLVAPWGEVRAFLRDEERAQRLTEHARETYEKALAVAVATILESSGEPGVSLTGGVVSMPESEFQRLSARAGLSDTPSRLHHLAYRDRSGTVYVPLDGMTELAGAFAAAEPMTVLRHVDRQESELSLRGHVPGDRWWHEYLRQQAPGFALARRWAGPEREADALRAEIARLRSLAASTASELAQAGLDRAAQRVLRAVNGG